LEKRNGNRHVIGGAVGLEFADNRKVELDGGVLEMAAHAARAANDRANGLSAEPRLQQDIVRLEDDPHAGSVVAPHQHRRRIFAEERGNDDVDARSDSRRRGGNPQNCAISASVSSPSRLPRSAQPAIGLPCTAPPPCGRNATSSSPS